jgi:triacylglycerol lipase
MATLGRILSWWAQDYAYAAYWQVRATLRPGRRESYESGTGRPVVVIPGVWEPWGFLGPVIEALHDAGHPVRVIPALGRNGRPVPDAARTVAGFLEDHDLRDVVIVAHSKGGLIGKYVMGEHDPDDRITAMVAICTPFAGSDYARYMAMRTLRAFSPSDPTTVMLQANLETNARITTIAGVFDPHIPAIVGLEGATNITIQDGGHFRLLDRPEVIDIVVEVAGRTAARQEDIVDETVAAATDASAPPAPPAEESVDTPLPPDAEVTREGTSETPTVP